MSDSTGMWRRVRALLAARFGAAADGGLPWAGIAMQVLVAGVLCGVAADVVGPFGYSLFALTVAGALACVPLLGEAGQLLWADEARAWVESLPARPLEARLARRLHALVTLGALSLGALLPAALLAPGEMGAGQRALLVVTGEAQTVALAAALLALLAILGGRATALLVGFQTLAFLALFAGGVLGLRHVTALAELHSWSDLPAVARALPPAWFAAPLISPAALALAAAGTLAALVVLAAAPTPDEPAPVGRAGVLDLALRPLRRAVWALWLRPAERATFDLVADALPREREFVLRTYPLIGLPLAMLVVGARDQAGPGREALLALFLLAPAAYTPLLSAQLPASRSFRAAWLLATAPVSPRALHAGAFKALVTRFLAPLYAGLALVVLAFDPPTALRLTPPAFLFALVSARASYGRCARGLPLSRSPDDLAVGDPVFGAMLGIAVLAAGAAVAAAGLVDGAADSLAAAAVLLIAWRVLERSAYGPNETRNALDSPTP